MHIMSRSATSIRIATRRSPLALAQADMVRIALLADDPDCEVTLVPMTTTGDRTPQKNLPEWGYKGLFTKEIEDALLEDRADIAVHSMKDMPSLLPDGLTIAGMLEREDPRDAFLSLHYDSLSALPPGSRIGSSSVRRAAMLRSVRPDCEVVEFRGNVNTRLQKLQQGEADATLLAVAGLNRLGLADHITEILPVTQMLPAVAQGAIGMECRMNDEALRARIQTISYSPTMIAVGAERAVLKVLDGSCKTPLGAYATIERGEIHIRARLLLPDGSQQWEQEVRGATDAAESLGQALGEALRDQAV